MIFSPHSLHNKYFYAFVVHRVSLLQNDFFLKKLFSANCFGPDQDRCSVSPVLGPNCLYILSAED